jgi:iron complex transport system ATP-binding protein
MLQAVDVSFGYGRTAGRSWSFARRHDNHAHVLRNVSVDVERGSIVALLGPNGSGKTTLLGVLAGILPPATGRVLIEGRPISRLNRRELARHIAVVPQSVHATFDYTVLDMVLMGRYPHLGSFQLEGAADQQIARDALAATGTLPLAARRFATLSGGEKQRVVIAGALAQASDILLLDEPTAALDLRYQFEIAALLRRLNEERGVSMVVSTHDLNLAAALCGQVVLLKDGRVLARGATAETLTPANIRSLYDVDADVHFDSEARHITVVPVAHR